MEHEVRDGRLYLHRAPEEREPLLKRLLRVEGQVRGLRQMIEADRYCPDEVQQANAIAAAVREVALLVVQDHLAAAGRAIGAGGGEAAVADIMAVLRAAARL